MSLDEKVDFKGENEFVENAPSRSGTLAAEAEDPAVIKNLLRRMDVRLLPLLSLLYLLSFLDRTAIGNARIAGLATDLGMDGMQYNVSVTVFFILYGLLEVPSNLMLKRYGAKFWIPFIMFWWGVVMMCSAFVTSYGGLLACRTLLGGAEAGLFPGVTYYLTLWYKRSESQFRLGVFFSAATVAGAFGGLLAFGLSKMDGIGGLRGWAWIFLIEGLLTIVAAIFAYFAIIDSPLTAKFLTPEEVEIIEYRLAHDGTSVPMASHYDIKFVWQAFMDPKIYLAFIIYVGALTPVYSIALNLPVITVGLGYSGPIAQLITVPVYVFSAIVVIILSVLSDKYHLRSPFIIGGLLLGMVGYLILLLSYNDGVRYLGCFLAGAGMYGAFPSVVCILTNNVGGKTKRTVEIGMLIGLGGMCGMISSNVFRVVDAPHYSFGLIINLGLAAFGILSTILMVIHLRIENKKKLRMIESGEAAKFTDEELSNMGDKSPFFVYTY